LQPLYDKYAVLTADDDDDDCFKFGFTRWYTDEVLLNRISSDILSTVFRTCRLVCHSSNSELRSGFQTFELFGPVSCDADSPGWSECRNVNAHCWCMEDETDRRTAIQYKVLPFYPKGSKKHAMPGGNEYESARKYLKR
ncbi:hypothetical protein CLF_113596, partial [Clonorchis sinensis]